MSRIGHSISKRLDRLVQSTQENLGTAEKTEYDSEFQRLENQVKILKEDYKTLIKMAKQYLQPHPGLRIEEVIYEKLELDRKNKVSKTPIGALGDIMIVTGDKLGQENNLGNALYKTGQVEREIGKNWLEFEIATNDKFIDPLQVFIEREIKDAEELRKRLEKARLDMDSTKTKVKKASRTINYNPDVDYKIRKESEKLQKAEAKYKTLLNSSSSKFHYIAEDSQIVDLLSFIKSQMDYYGKSYRSLEDLYNSVSSSRNSERRKQLINGEAGIQAYATYDYSAASEDELSVKAGDLLTIVDQETGSDGWWEAISQDGRSGYVPSNYVDFEKKIAVSDYFAKKEDDLSFKQGAEVTILHKDVGEDGIAYGFVEGRTGFFPLKCLQSPEIVKPKSMDSLNISQLFKSKSDVSLNSIPRSNSQLSNLGSVSPDPTLMQGISSAKNDITISIEILNSAFQDCTAGKLLAARGNANEEDLLSAAEKLAKSSKKFIETTSNNSSNLDIISSLLKCSEDVQNLRETTINFASTFRDPNVQMKIIGSGMSVVMVASRIMNDYSEGKGLKEAGKAMVTSVSNLIDSILSSGKPKEENPTLFDEFEGLKVNIQEASTELKQISTTLDPRSENPMSRSTIPAIEKASLLAQELLVAAKKRQAEMPSSQPNQYKKDSIWDEGLFSAAKAVSDSVLSLIKKTEDILQSKGRTEELVAVSMLVQSTVAHLATASKIAKPSNAHEELQLKAQLLHRTVDQVISFAKESNGEIIAIKYEPETGYAKKKAQQLDSQARVISLEQELEMERARLYELRKKEYGPGI